MTTNFTPIYIGCPGWLTQNSWVFLFQGIFLNDMEHSSRIHSSKRLVNSQFSFKKYVYGVNERKRKSNLHCKDLQRSMWVFTILSEIIQVKFVLGIHTQE